MKWWRETAVWCGMSWCDFKCFVVWIRLCVVFSVMSVQYRLCVSRIQCTQCSVSVYRVGSASMQVVFRVYSISSVSLARSVYRVESVAYTVNGVQC